MFNANFSFFRFQISIKRKRDRMHASVCHCHCDAINNGVKIQKNTEIFQRNNWLQIIDLFAHTMYYLKPLMTKFWFEILMNCPDSSSNMWHLLELCKAANENYLPLIREEAIFDRVKAFILLARESTSLNILFHRCLCKRSKEQTR